MATKVIFVWKCPTCGQEARVQNPDLTPSPCTGTFKKPHKRKARTRHRRDYVNE